MAAACRLAAALVATAFAVAAWAAAPAPLAHDGLIDLGAANAEHVLRGEWGFAWQQFVDPAAAAPLPAKAPVPAPWNDLTADGKPAGPDGFASYSLDVRCPAGKQLALSVPAQRTAMRLYVNGRLAASQGEPGRSATQARPAIARRAVLTDPFACPLHIVVHLSNWSHRSGGFVRAPVAGPMEELAPDHGQRLALDTILLGAYLVMGILPVFFFFARREQVALLFGLFCLAQTVYADMTGERLLLQLAGAETPWEVYLRIEYLSWFASAVLFVLLIDRLFPRTLHPRAVRGLVVANVLPMLVVALTPARVYSYLVFYGQAVGVVVGIYVTVSIARAARHGRTDAGVILVGMGFLLLVILTNLLQFYADITQGGITALGLLVFVLSPGIVLLRRLARLLNAEELRSAEEREKVDLLVRATQAGILDWDGTHQLTRYSPRLLEILGYPADTDTSGWPPIFERIHPADRALVQEAFLEQLRDRSVKGGEMRHPPFEYRLLRRDGTPVWVHAEAISLRAPDGRTLRYICSYHDITDHRAVAEGLKRQNAALAENARLREDVERMSRHDLKTPLNSIIGVARLLREDAAVQPDQRELLAIAERAGYRLLEMVNLSLDLSRMELGTYDFHPQAVNLLDVLARVLPDLHGLAQSCRVSVRMERSFDAPVYARAEELLCYSILANLLKNAIEATPPGGVVTIGIDAGDPLRVRIHNPARVPDAVAGRFFDKYVTAGKPNGTGLGTYSARLMARVQEGELEMRTGDAGTVLTLTLRALGQEALPPPPDATHPREPSARRATVSAADFAPCRVLVVDDDEYNRLLLLRYLPAPPFTVEVAGNGQAATEAMARQWPDVVLVDMEMPVMDGLETVAWIRAHEAREQRKPCLVLMMSSNDDGESIRRGLLAGSNRYLAKPFTRETLLATLHDLLSGGAALPMQVPLDLGDPGERVRHAPVPADAAVRVDAELLPEVPAFLESRRGMVEGMAAALADEDRQQLRAVAHRAAGGLALFGFHWAAWQARRISSRAADADAAELRRDIDTLRAHLRAVQVR